MDLEKKFGVDLRSRITEIEETVPANLNEVALILGDSGEGKSSILNYIAEVSLEAKFDEEINEFEIITQTPIYGAEINKGSVSKTKMPAGWEKYWDCPGFDDTRGPEIELINAFSIYKLTENAKNVKILLVISENTIKGNRSQSFLKVINNVANCFDQTNNLSQSLGLIVTKREKLNIKILRNIFSRLLAEQEDQKTFTAAQKNILQSWISENSHIFFFDIPKKEGAIATTQRNLIVEGIEQIEWLNKPQPKISIESEAREEIRFLFHEVLKDLKDVICQHFYDEAFHYLKGLVINSQRIYDLRKNLLNLKERMDEISINDQNLLQYEKNIKLLFSISETIKSQSMKNIIGKLLSQFLFLMKIKPDSLMIEGNTSSWYAPIKSSIDAIICLLSQPEKKQSGGKIIIKGFIVATSAINNVNSQEITEVEFYSLNRIFLDCDLNLPGANLTLISPQIHIEGAERLINLKGAPQIERIEDSNGLDGLPGLPGKPGGNLLVKCNVCSKEYETSRVTIDVSGGEGGKGQKGRNGSDGSDGGDGGKEKVEKKEQSCLKSRERFKAEYLGDYIEGGIKFFLTFNEKFAEVYESFEPGETGGDAGKGGRGGEGGLPGTVTWIPTSPLLPLIVINNEGPEGLNGEHGRPGIGGRNGPLYCGVYVDEKVSLLQNFKECLQGGAGMATGMSTGVAMANLTAQSCQVIGTSLIKDGVTVGTTEIVKQGVEVAIMKGAQQIGKTFVREIANQGGKTMVKVGSSTKALALKGLGAGLIAQAILSPISAIISSGWKEKPYLKSNETGKANDGVIPNFFNDFMRQKQETSKSIDVQEKRKKIEGFFKKKGHGDIVEKINWNI